MKKMRPVYPDENILDRYLMTNKLLGESMPFIKKSVRKYMREEDIDFFDNLPDTITIYRGTSVSEAIGSILDIGQSWTLELKVAEFFADTHCAHYSEDRCIMKAIIPKEFIFAYTNEREEKECIVNYVKLQDISYQKRKT